MTQQTPPIRDCFHSFNQSIEQYTLPAEFTFPFNYQAHPLCQLAATQLQQYLATQTELEHEFGIDKHVEGTNIGKMFGVLLVRNAQNEVGYLAAFSGKLGGRNDHAYFVPPIVDLLHEESFYRQGEDIISAINRQIEKLENQTEYLACKTRHQELVAQSVQELELYKENMKLAKQNRDAERERAALSHSPQELAAIEETLKHQSICWQYDFKHLAKQWRSRLAESEAQVEVFVKQITNLKEERRTKSAALQQTMFNHYQFLNAHGVSKTVCEIFINTDQKIPPAGAGDCAEPKLLQYAYQNRMQPLAMAQFWWGQSPRSEIRKHGNFYPSCRGKCEPILGHMLQGLRVEQNPVLQASSVIELSIVYEDEAIVVINKPAEFLSVPGKIDCPSIYDLAKEKYPNATGPIIVHRLDMSTSGLMLLAKTKESHQHLQEQFESRTIKKRYVALLEGLVAENEGTIELPLRVDLDNRPRQLVCYQHGKHALTLWKVLERGNAKTRIMFFPVTGRTHQLRVHAAHSQGLNCPIVGDDLYGQKANRLHLHAQYIEFTHPLTNERLSFEVEAEF